MGYPLHGFVQDLYVDIPPNKRAQTALGSRLQSRAGRLDTVELVDLDRFPQTLHRDGPQACHSN